MTQKQWIQKQAPEKQVVEGMVTELKLPEAICELLAQRGIFDLSQAKEFFYPNLDSLHDPFLMKDMDQAVERLNEAIVKNQKILIYGDYDVDGTTSVALVFSFLSELGANCEFYIPDRYTEGYGFSMKAVEWASTENFNLIITLDCGIKDGIRIEKAKTLGMDVIVCDHHVPGPLPNAIAILDPKRSDCDYPYKGLSGCGVGFKLLEGWTFRYGKEHKEKLLAKLDLLTISIGADIVPLTGENRVLASFGLQVISTNRRPGIKAMLEKAAFKRTELTITDVVFILAPRINAAGRISSGKKAVELLLAKNEEEAMEISTSIENDNKARRERDKEITIEAKQMIHDDPFYMSSFTSVVKNEGWHKGVIGIVASRLVEEFYKPAIVLTEIEGKLSGSARSIPGIDLYEVLGQCSDVLEQFGGHAMAAGLSLTSENYLPFRSKFDDLVKGRLNSELPIPYLEYDLEVKLSELTEKFYRILARFAPFGPENMKPVFLARNLFGSGITRTVGEDHSHLKTCLGQGVNKENKIEGIGFDLGRWAAPILNNAPVDVLFTLEENDWKGNKSLQMQIKDIRLSN